MGVLSYVLGSGHCPAPARTAAHEGGPPGSVSATVPSQDSSTQGPRRKRTESFTSRSTSTPIPRPASRLGLCSAPRPVKTACEAPSAAISPLTSLSISACARTLIPSCSVSPSSSSSSLPTNAEGSMSFLAIVSSSRVLLLAGDSHLGKMHDRPSLAYSSPLAHSSTTSLDINKRPRLTARDALCLLVAESGTCRCVSERTCRPLSVRYSGTCEGAQSDDLQPLRGLHEPPSSRGILHLESKHRGRPEGVL
jgi:hypothetical protein